MLRFLSLDSGPLILATDEQTAHFSDGGLLASGAWLIPVVPMVMAFLIVFFGKRSPWRGWAMATGTMAFVALYGTALFISNLGDGITYQGSV